MPDPDPAVTPPAVEPATPAVAVAVAEPPPATPPVEEPFDRDRAMRTIENQRAEEKRLKNELKAAKEKGDRLDAIEAEQLSEQEKLQKRAEEAEQKVAEAAQKLRTANLIAELSRPEHGIVNAAAAARLIEGVEYGDDDRPTNLGDVLPGFLETNAFLVGTPAALGQPTPPNVDGGAGRTAGPAPALTADELEAARSAGMSPERYAALKGVENLSDFEKLQQRERAAAAQ